MIIGKGTRSTTIPQLQTEYQEIISLKFTFTNILPTTAHFLFQELVVMTSLERFKELWEITKNSFAIFEPERESTSRCSDGSIQGSFDIEAMHASKTSKEWN